MKNQIYTVTIEGYTSEAYGVARVEGRAVFVPRALKGETWQIRLVKVTESAVYARGEMLLQPSPERRESLCPYFGKCGGCDTWHMSYGEELRFKLDRVNDALKHIGQQTVLAEEIIGSDAVTRYRNKGIFAVAAQDGAVQCGFFRERSHELIPVDSCLIQNELSERAAKAVTAFLLSSGIDAYDEASGKGTVRHVFCRKAVKTADAVVCVVSARGFGDRTLSLVAAIREACPEASGIVLNINKTKGNTVLSGDFYTLWGRADMTDELCGSVFSISPQAFFQIVIGAEIVPEAVENARENARTNGIENIEFICADAGKAAETLAKRELHPEAVVVDPPRKGMDEKAIHAIASMQPDRVVYVSCNPATLARDILRLSSCGYTLQNVTAVDMFPRTSHVETVCCLYHQKDKFFSVPYEPKDVK